MEYFYYWYHDLLVLSPIFGHNKQELRRRTGRIKLKNRIEYKLMNKKGPQIKSHISHLHFCPVTFGSDVPDEVTRLPKLVQKLFASLWFHLSPDTLINAPPGSAQDILQRSQCVIRKVPVKPLSRRRNTTLEFSQRRV